jgi:hypothetical protein
MRPQAPHDGLADGLRRNLVLEPRLNRVDDVVDEHGDLLQVDRALVAGRAHRVDQLLAVELLAAPSRLITTMPSRTSVSIVVNRWPHSRHSRRLRIVLPSLLMRESITLSSIEVHLGQRMG